MTQRKAQLLGSLQQKGTVGGFTAFGIDGRSEMTFDPGKAALCEYAFHGDAQTALYGSGGC